MPAAQCPSLWQLPHDTTQVHCTLCHPNHKACVHTQNCVFRNFRVGELGLRGKWQSFKNYWMYVNITIICLHIPCLSSVLTLPQSWAYKCIHTGHRSILGLQYILRLFGLSSADPSFPFSCRSPSPWNPDAQCYIPICSSAPDCHDYWGLSFFCVNFRIDFCSSVKNAIVILTEMTLNH